jgi:uncharacterized protein YeaO (DUF488 family)
MPLSEKGLMMEKRHVQVRRIYDDPTPSDGTRVLVDRIWPRGMSKARAHLDDWCKEIAPSTELRTWYRHDPALFEEFARRYRVELASAGRAAALSDLRQQATRRMLTLLTASRAVDISEAVVLAQLIASESHSRNN